MKTLLLFCGFLLPLSFLHAQSSNDWTWYEEDAFELSNYDVKVDNAGNIWTAAYSGKLHRYDGTEWTIHDPLDDGFVVDYLFSLDITSDGKIWTQSRDFAYEYTIATNTWVEFDLSGIQSNISGRNIKVQNDNRIWWSTYYALLEYDGTDWVSHSYNNNLPNMNGNRIADFAISPSGERWISTPASICIDFPCFTPAGLIRITDQDTTYFDSNQLGLPTAYSTDVRFNAAGNPVAILTDSLWVNENYMIEYVNGAWTSPETIPALGHVMEVEIAANDRIYIAYKDFLITGKDGIWDVINIDTAHIHRISGIELDDMGGIYIAGNYGNGVNRKGVVGYLPPLEYAIRGLVYADLNSNGTFDGLDTPMKNQFVKTTNDDRITFSKIDGEYSLLFADEGTYEIEGVLPKYFIYSNPTNGIQSVTLTNIDPAFNAANFGFEPDTDAIDLSIAHTNRNRANPGFNLCYSIQVNNIAPVTNSGQAIFTFDPILSFVSSDVTPTWINGNEINYDINDLEWLENRKIQVCFSIPPDPNLVGTSLTSSVTIAPTNGVDLDTTNNTGQLELIITGPYDPNYISVDPVGIGLEGEIPLNTRSLLYTIHFQNIGTDTARNVIIDNPLDLDLDLFSLRVLGSSHEFEMDYLDEDQMLRWTFPNINLVDSLTNAIGSNGFVQYRIDIKNPDEGMVLNNSAQIYFDFNLPIATNTTINTLADISTLTQELPANPACEFSMISTPEYVDCFINSGRGTAYVFDLNGRLMAEKAFVEAKARIDISTFGIGAYFMVVDVDACGKKAAQLFVKNSK